MITFRRASAALLAASSLLALPTPAHADETAEGNAGGEVLSYLVVDSIGAAAMATGADAIAMEVRAWRTKPMASRSVRSAINAAS